MTRILILFTTAFLMACTGGGSGGGQSALPAAPVDIKNKNPGTGGVAVIFGDSIANSHGSTQAWATIQNCVFSRLGVFPENKAVDGETSEAALERIKDVVDLKPKLVIVSLGGNDVLQHAARNNFTATETLANMRAIFRRLVQSGALVVHLGLNPPTPGAERLAQIKAAADAEGALYLPDVMAGMWGNPSLMSDTIHPNDQGYKQICERIVDGVRGFYP